MAFQRLRDTQSHSVGLGGGPSQINLCCSPSQRPSLAERSGPSCPAVREGDGGGMSSGSGLSFFAMNLALARTVERGSGLSGCTGSFCPCSVSSHAVSSSGEAQTERPSRLTGIPDFCQRCATDTVWPEEFHDLSPALQGSILRLWLRFRHNQPEVRYQFSAQSAMRRRHRYRTSHPGIR
jgi:hypothetical protein